MPYVYFVHNELRLVVSIGSGSVNWSEIKVCQDQTRTDPDFNSQFDQLVDMRAATSFDMITEHVRTLARRMVFPSPQSAPL